MSDGLRDEPALELRAGTPADVPRLCVLAMHVYVATYCEGGLRPDQAREALACYSAADFEQRLAEGHVFTLAHRGEQLLGFSETDVPATTAEAGLVELAGAMELMRLYVTPGAQGRRLGRALLEHAERQAALRSCRGLWLSAWAGNAKALRFYGAAGYRDLGRTDYRFEDRVYENRVLFKPVVPGATAASNR